MESKGEKGRICVLQRSWSNEKRHRRKKRRKSKKRKRWRGRLSELSVVDKDKELK